MQSQSIAQDITPASTYEAFRYFPLSLGESLAAVWIDNIFGGGLASEELRDPLLEHAPGVIIEHVLNRVESPQGLLAAVAQGLQQDSDGDFPPAIDPSKQSPFAIELEV